MKIKNKNFKEKPVYLFGYPGFLDNRDNNLFYLFVCAFYRNFLLPKLYGNGYRALTSSQHIGVSAERYVISKSIGWEYDISATKVVCSDGEVKI